MEGAVLYLIIVILSLTRGGFPGETLQGWCVIDGVDVKEDKHTRKFICSEHADALKNDLI